MDDFKNGEDYHLEWYSVLIEMLESVPVFFVFFFGVFFFSPHAGGHITPGRDCQNTCCVLDKPDTQVVSSGTWKVLCKRVSVCMYSI